MFWEDDSEPHARSGKLGSRRGLRNKQREKKRKKKINKKEEDLGLTGLISLKNKCEWKGINLLLIPAVL